MTKLIVDVSMGIYPENKLGERIKKDRLIIPFESDSNIPARLKIIDFVNFIFDMYKKYEDNPKEGAWK